jgi:ubiquinone/menaquinone biosynthesis C-methylase UbiE
VQWLIMQELSSAYTFREKSLLHFAPESIFRSEFRKLFAQVTTTDLAMPDVDVKADICRLPFANASFDVVFLSHVLEHVKEDRRAMCEVRRVLRSQGIAIVEAPITREKTIEYDCPNIHEFGHVRNTGPDYYDRFTDLFRLMKKYTSEDFPHKFQPYIYCNWTRFPTPESPLRQPMPGLRHPIMVAVYFV